MTVPSKIKSKYLSLGRINLYLTRNDSITCNDEPVAQDDSQILLPNFNMTVLAKQYFSVAIIQPLIAKNKVKACIHSYGYELVSVVIPNIISIVGEDLIISQAKMNSKT